MDVCSVILFSDKNSQQQQTSSMNETTSLLQATLFGKGLKQPRRQEPVTTQQPPTSMQNQTQKIQGMFICLPIRELAVITCTLYYDLPMSFKQELHYHYINFALK